MEHLFQKTLFFTGQSLIFNTFNLKAGGMPYVVWCPLWRLVVVAYIFSGFSTMVYYTPCSTDIYNRGHQQNDVINRGGLHIPSGSDVTRTTTLTVQLSIQPLRWWSNVAFSPQIKITSTDRRPWRDEWHKTLYQPQNVICKDMRLLLK